MVLAALVLAGGGLVAYVSQEFTECHATFATEEAAERAADSMSDAGFDAEVASAGSLEASSGETGDDARGFREEFRSVLRREGGEPSDSGESGCIERPFFN